MDPALSDFLDSIEPGQGRQWREPGSYARGDELTPGFCAGCENRVLAYVTWPADGSRPLAFDAGRNPRTLTKASPRVERQQVSSPEVRRVEPSPAPGEPTFEHARRYNPTGEPIETAAHAGQCDFCGMRYRVGRRTLVKRAGQARAAGLLRFTVPAS